MMRRTLVVCVALLSGCNCDERLNRISKPEPPPAPAPVATPPADPTPPPADDPPQEDQLPSTECAAASDSFAAADVTPPGAVDVLFVFDDSTSMKPRQQAVKNHIAHFIDRLNATSIDFHLSATTTTLGGLLRPPGALVLGSDAATKVVTPGSDAVDRFWKIMERIDNGGSGAEYGYLTAEIALSAGDHVVDVNVSADYTIDASWDRHGRRDADFWRDAARLVVIFISDEDDGGSEHIDLRSVASYEAPLRALKPNPEANLRLIHVVDPGVTTQECADSDADKGTPRYHEGVTRFGAPIASLIDFCDDVGNALSVAGDVAASAACTFALSKTPDATSPITVSVDGVALPKTAWRVNGATLEIVGACPQSPARITVTYCAL